MRFKMDFADYPYLILFDEVEEDAQTIRKTMNQNKKKANK